MTQVLWNLQVIPGYSTYINPVIPTVYPNAQPVLLTGYVEYEPGNLIEQYLAGVVPVLVDITNNGATRTITTYTTRNGSFSTTFYPASTEYGTYIAGARHPSSIEISAQSEWRILGIRAIPHRVVLNGEAFSEEFERTFYNATVICNDGPGSLTGLTATPLLTNTRDISIEIFLRGSASNTTLEPGDQLVMDIRVVASRLLTGSFLVVIEASEATTLQVVVSLRIEPVLPSFSIDPSMLDARIVRGRSRLFEFNVTNIGRNAAHNVRSVIPDADFISLISFGNTQHSDGNLRLESGQSAILSILTQTQTNQQLGEIGATIIVTSSEVSTSLPITLTVSSDYLMNLTVVVEDEYTYFATGRPLVDNAVITLINNQRNIRVTETTDLGNGTATFTSIFEDRYEMYVEASSHQTLRQTIITSVNDPVVTVFIGRQAVTYTWTVIPVTYEDEYTIPIVAEFEAHVPIPVVTVTPTEIDLNQLESGAISSFQLNVTNHGLIRADNVSIELPDHPFLVFSTSTNVLGDLEPLSSIIISVHSTRRSIQKRLIVDWTLYLITVKYSYVCNEPQLRSLSVVLKLQTIRRNQLTQIVRRIIDDRRDMTRRDAVTVDTRARNSTVGFMYYRELGGLITGIPTFSFSGFTTETPFYCNPCNTAILECLKPSVYDLLGLPFAGCIPLILTHTSPFSSVTNAISWIQCTVGNRLTDFLICAVRNNVFGICLRHLAGSSNIARLLYDLIEALYPIQQSIDLGIEVLGDEKWIEVGDPLWPARVLRPALDDESEAGALISANELSAILTAQPPNGTTTDMVARMVERINNTISGWNSGQLEPHEGSNMASFSTVQDLSLNISTYNDRALDKGFSSYLDAYNFASGELNQVNDIEEEAGVCAVVRIRILQELALTREAFQARLEIENQEDTPLQQIDLEISITNSETGEQATHLFSVDSGTLSGSLSTVDHGRLLLPSGMSGTVEWLIIPYSEAAPESDHLYDVGGSFNYVLDGENITVPLSPSPVTVRPDPSLLVHYFLERYVVGDDPLTDAVEPSVPFTLGVAVRNAGYGIAYSLRISSGQPKIVDNERGLLINFMIVGATIGSESISPSLTVMFGDLTPNATSVARWHMVSNLKGEFSSYSATFENMNPLGDPKLSILDEIEIHELIRNVVMYNADEDDGILDFLVNDQNDYLAYPDALYSSKTLQQHNVSVGTVLSVHATSDNVTTSLVVRVTSNTTGWIYYRHEDTQGILSKSAPSVNGTKHEDDQVFTIPPENSWITRKRDSSGSETFYLHILDYVETADDVAFIMDLCKVDCPTSELPPTSKRKT